MNGGLNYQSHHYNLQLLLESIIGHVGSNSKGGIVGFMIFSIKQVEISKNIMHFPIDRHLRVKSHYMAHY